MDIRILSILGILIIISSGTAYAQNTLISVETNHNNYDEGDIIMISGNVPTIIADTPITLQVFKDGTLLDIAQIEVAKDNNYAHTIKAEGKLWSNPGEYIIRVVYGEGNIAETVFNFTPKTALVETTTNAIVDAGEYGTFDIKYTMVGGTVESTIVDPNIFGIILKINALDEGKIILDLPREFIDAEKQNGQDETFIVLIDDKQITYDESILNSDIRTITINFEKDDSEIKIIGTYVIPEFGTIVMIVLTIGIMASILLTRNRFQIKI